jgi:hypothetical protein
VPEDPARLVLTPPADAVGEGWLRVLQKLAARYPGPTQLAVRAGGRLLILGDGFRVEGANTWLRACLDEITDRKTGSAYKGVEEENPEADVG